MKSTQVLIGNQLPEGEFEIHSLFQKVVNLVNSKNEILFITKDIQNLSANGIYLANIQLNDIQSVSVDENAIQIDSSTIFTGQCEVFDAKFDFNSTRFSDFENWLTMLVKENLPLFPKKSLIALLMPDNEQYFDTGFDKYFFANAQSSIAKMLSGELHSGINQIKGTGFGLTPSGDDFIAGLLLGTFFTQARNTCDLSVLRNEISNIAISNNLLANSFIYNASKGFFHQAFKNFLYLYPEIFDHENRLQTLLSYGETSGADLLTGFIFSVQNKIGYDFKRPYKKRNVL